jgi:hypothetical protein
MPNDPHSGGPKDPSRINLSEDQEMRYWTKALGVSERNLRSAVFVVGNSADKVRQHLGK